MHSKKKQSVQVVHVRRDARSAQEIVTLSRMTVQFLGSSEMQKAMMIFRQISIDSVTGHNYDSSSPNAKS